MDSRHSKMRTNVESDRLSSLPDELIHKVLSFIDIQEAIGMSGLSSRWRFIWTSLPYLNFSSDDFYIGDKEDYFHTRFIKFAKNVLSRRNTQVQVSSINLGCDMFESTDVKTIMEYAFSNHVDCVTLTRLSPNNFDFPLSLFSSESLKHLTLTGSQYGHLFIRASTWELLALTTLYLDYVTFYYDDDDDTDRKGVGLFSKCKNMQNLTLKHCEVKGLDGFYICHPVITNLTIENGLENGDGKVVNIVAPKLVNLIIRDCGCKHFISAPELVNFHFKGFNLLDVSADGFPLLETMHLCIENLKKGDVHKIVSFHRQLSTVKFLTVNLELVEFLSSQSKLISQQPSPFANLRSLKIYPENLEIDRKRSMSTKVKNYFLSHSPGAAFTMIPREEARVMSMAICLRDFIENSRVWLKKEKLNIQRNKGRIGQIKPQVENQMAQQGTQMQHHFWGLTGPIKSWWIDMKLVIDLGKSKIDNVVTRLEFIQAKIVQLPASTRSMLLAPFCSLIAEANTVISVIKECMKIQLSEDQSRLNVCFQDIIA